VPSDISRIAWACLCDPPWRRDQRSDEERRRRMGIRISIFPPTQSVLQIAYAARVGEFLRKVRSWRQSPLTPVGRRRRGHASLGLRRASRSTSHEEPPCRETRPPFLGRIVTLSWGRALRSRWGAAAAGTPGPVAPRRAPRAAAPGRVARQPPAAERAPAGPAAQAAPSGPPT